MKLTIQVESGTLEAELFDTPSGQAIYNALPIDGSAQLWGDEIYFSIPVESPLEDNARDLVEVGDLGYWPLGKAFCIFFGPTPMSDEGGPPRAASSVNLVGKVSGDLNSFRSVGDGTKVELRKA